MEKKDVAPVNEVIYGLMHDLFNAAGMPVHPNNQAKIERIAKEFSKAVSKAARLEALTLVERLQKATKGGFEAFAETLDRLEKDIISLKRERHQTNELLSTLTNEINKTTELLKSQLEADNKPTKPTIQ